LSRKIKSLLITAAALLLLAFILVPRMGTFLVLDHELREADAMVVLMGSVPVRTLEAVDLYREGYSDKVLLVRSCPGGRELLEEKGITLPGHAEQTRMVADELGVEDEDLVVLEGGARSTREEAEIIRVYLEENSDLDSLILVTSSFHTRRSYAIFNRALAELERELTIISRASRYDAFQAERWWEDRESSKQVVFEYLKLAHFYGWEQFR